MADDKTVKAARPVETPDQDDVVRGLTAAKGRPTPSRRKMEEEAEEVQGNFIQRSWWGLREYFAGVRTELSKVTWPTREDTRRLTIIVIAVVIASALVLGLIAALFSQVFAVGLRNPIILVAIMLVGAGLGLLLTRMVRVRSTTY